MRSWRFALLVAVLLAIPLLSQAGQVAFDYSTAPRTIRACQLVVPDTYTNPNPYVLATLARSVLRPAGWKLENPLAPARIDQGIWDRWLNANYSPGLSGANYWSNRGLDAGSPLLHAVPREWPQYWEVVLTDATAEQLAQFDVIYLAAHSQGGADLSILSPRQRAGLQRAVENGAVLWVDNAGGTVAEFPVPRNLRVPAVPPFDFGGMGGSLQSRTAPDPGHQLLTSPHYLSSREINWLGANPDGPGGPLAAFRVLLPMDNDVQLRLVVNVVTDSGVGISVAAAHYGQGAVVLTAENVGQDIEEWYLFGQNRPSVYQEPDLKLGYNILAYGGAARSAQAGPANRGVDYAPLRPPLDLLWQFPAPWDADLLGPVVGSPVVQDGRVFVLSGRGVAPSGAVPPQLVALSASPASVSGYEVLGTVPFGNNESPRATSPSTTLILDPGLGVPINAVLISRVDLANGAGWVTAYDASDLGVVLWNRAIGGYANAAVVDLTSPLIYKNWVFVVSTEYDPSLMGGGPEGTYSRVHCFDLRTGGTAGVYWVYPDSARGEEQKLIPPLHDPVWVSDPGRPELPPAGEIRPYLTTNLRTPLGLPVEAALLFNTAVSFRWSAGQVSVGGAERQYAVVPLPYAASGEVLLNADYLTARLNLAGAISVTSPATRDDASGLQVVVNSTPLSGPDGASYADFNNAEEVLGFLASLSPAAPYNNPLTLRHGCRVNLEYTHAGPGSPATEAHVLPGPVAWVRGISGRHGGEDAGRLVETGGALSVADTQTGTLLSRWQPATDAPGPSGATTAGSIVAAAAALDARSVVAASNLNTMGALGRRLGALHGVSTGADLSIRLGPGLSDSLGVATEAGLTVTVLGGAAVPVAQYQLDHASRVLSFVPTAIERYAGRAVVVDWTDTTGTSYTGELHMAPPLAHFEYVGGFVRLRYYPVIRDSISLTLADGTPVTDWDVEPTVAFDLDGDGSTEQVLPGGWLILRDARVTNAVGGTLSVVGKEILVSYRGWSWADRSVVAMGPGGDLPRERHQVPVEMGHSVGGVVMSGQTAVVGTLGVDVAAGGLGTARGAHSPAHTLMAALWDPVKRLVTGSLSRPAFGPGAPLIPGAPAAAGGRVYVGTSQALPAPEARGYVSCLGPRRTLICDGNRVVETTGSTTTWVLTGAQSPIYGRTAPEPELLQPFNRPAKASALRDGNYLIVDTGNNRVLVVDRQGRQLWPLDQYGHDYYTSPPRTDAGVTGGIAGNNNLKLSQPSDAYRFVADSDGDGLLETHTVIADSGHSRVLMVVTNDQPGDPDPLHQVRQVTPPYVRPYWDRSQQLALRYTRAQPIFDLGNNALIGFLCTASNLDRVVIVEAGTEYVDPDPASIPPGGTRPWSDWSWIYELDFPNLRHAEYFRYGDVAYVLVVAGGIGEMQQDGVWVWAVDATTGPVSGNGPFGAVWAYTDVDYARSGLFSTLITPAGVPQPRRFYPVSAKVLYPGLEWGGSVLITNYTGMIEHLRRENVGSAGTGLHGEVFEVSMPVNTAPIPNWTSGTDYWAGQYVLGATAPHDGLVFRCHWDHTSAGADEPGVGPNWRTRWEHAGTPMHNRIIPDPWGPEGNNPINQPAYAERY